MTFNPGQTLKSITYGIKPDALSEGTETLDVEFSTSPNAELANAFGPNNKLTVNIANR